ncbi:MAG: terminase small subunit [Desulfoprunum sp.]|jgi:phage terminase small subunit
MMKLTPKQETFCLAYLETGNASEAYRQSYNPPKMSPKTVNEASCRLLANGKIAARIKEIQDRILNELVWEKQHSLQILAGIARDESARATERIAAVKELNAMHGYNAPAKVTHQFTDPAGEPITGINITVRAVAPGEVRITNS